MQRLWSCGERRRGEGTPGPQCPDFMRLNDINSTEPSIGFSLVGKNPMGGSRRWPTVNHQPQQVQPPQALVPLPRVYGYELRKTAPIKSMPSGFPEFRADGRGPPGDAGSAVLSPESGAAQWRCAAAEVGSSTWRTLRHRNGTPVLRHIGSLAHLTAAATACSPIPEGSASCARNNGAVKFDFGQLQRAQTTSKR